MEKNNSDMKMRHDYFGDCIDENTKNRVALLFRSFTYDDEAIIKFISTDFKPLWIKQGGGNYLIFDIEKRKWTPTCVNGFRIFIKFILDNYFYSLQCKGVIFEEKTVFAVEKKLRKLKSIQNDFVTDQPKSWIDFDKKKNILLMDDNKIFNMVTKNIENNQSEYKLTVTLPYKSSILKLTDRDEFCKEYFTSLFNCEETAKVMINIIYSAISGNRIRGFIPLWGEGRNGKSFFLNLISDIFGDWVSTLSEKVFIDSKLSRTHNDEMVAVCQKRIGYITEAPEGGMLKESTIKEITGGDKITIRDLGKTSYEDTPTASLFFACNEPPEFSGSQSIQDRLFAFHFCNRFEKDVNYEDKIKEHYPYFLSYILRTGEIYKGDPPRTANMKSAFDNFKLNSDPLEQYLKETNDYEKYDPDNNEHKEEEFIFNQAVFKSDIIAWSRHTNKNTGKKLEIKTLYPNLESKGYKLLPRTKTIKAPRKGLRRNNEIDSMNPMSRWD